MKLQTVAGSTHISTVVLSKLVGMAAKMTGGIASMPTSWLEGITNKLSGGSLQNGIALKVDRSTLEINIKIVVKYGVKIQEVCRELKHNVKETVEHLTGLTIEVINIRVEGISLKQANA